MPSIQRPYILFDSSQEVYFRASTLPYVGFENSDDLPDGWLFDIKRWSSLFDLKLPSMPRLYDPSTQGLPEWDYFKSGVGDVKYDLKVRYIEERFLDNERLWIPQVDNGWYFRWSTDYFFYSDNSNVQYISSSDNIDGRNVVTLEKEYEPSYPILAASFTRDNAYGIPVYYKRCEQVSKFTGVYVGEEQQDTQKPATQTVDWSNVDTTKREFVVDTTIADQTRLLFNDDYIETVGNTPTSLQDFGQGDLVGASDGSEWQVFSLKKFPVILDTFSLYVVDSNNSTWEEWVRVDTYQDLIDAAALSPAYAYGSKYYYVDKDLGYVVFGDAESGIPSTGHEIVAMYQVTFRIEYEEADTVLNVNAWDADVSPISQSVNQGYVCVSHEELQAGTITLSVDTDIIPFSDPLTYGPVYVGNDFVTLRAEVLSPTGTKVPGIEVEFELTPSSIGSMAGSSTGISYGTTNGDGHAFTFYQTPVDAEEMGFYATSSSSVQGNNLVLDNTSAGLTLEDDIYLYKVLKDDPLLGMTFHEYLEDNLPDPPWWANPSTYPMKYEQWKAEMVDFLNLAEWTTSPTPNGRKVVVYNWDDAAINPMLGTTGAFVPTRPTSVDSTGSILTYPAGALIPSDPYYTVAYPPYFEDVGAYWVACTKYVEFRASCWSEVYNRRIYSNTIRVKVQLPRYLLGEYVNDQLYKIPFGWKFYDDMSNQYASGLDGATFLTINPHSGPYQIIDMVLDSNGDGLADFLDPYGYPYGRTGRWASAPESGVSFKINVDI